MTAAPGLYRFLGRRVRYDWERIFSRLGKVPDELLAAEICAIPKKVSRFRRLHKIKMYRGRDRADAYLGKVPDTRLSLRFGIPVRVLYRRRRQLGIPKFNRKKYFGDLRLAEYVRMIERTFGS